MIKSQNEQMDDMAGKKKAAAKASEEAPKPNAKIPLTRTMTIGAVALIIGSISQILGFVFMNYVSGLAAAGVFAFFFAVLAPGIIWNTIRRWNTIDASYRRFSTLANFWFLLAIACALIYLFTPMVVKAMGWQPSASDVCSGSQPPEVDTPCPNKNCITPAVREICTTSQMFWGSAIMLMLLHSIQLLIAKEIGKHVLK